MKNLVYTLIFGLAWICTGCADFLESQTPQGSVDEEQLQDCLLYTSPSPRDH